MSHPIIEGVSALAVITALAVAALIVPTPRFKPEQDKEPTEKAESAPVVKVEPKEEKPDNTQRVLTLEAEVQAAKSDLQELKKSLIEKKEKDNAARR
jgi:hypothetical protein